MEESLQSLLKNWPLGVILIAGIVALWRSNQQSNKQSNDTLVKLLELQADRNKELVDSLKVLTGKFEALTNKFADSNTHVAVAIETLSNGVDQLRTILAQRPCIAGDIQPQQDNITHIRRRGNGD